MNKQLTLIAILAALMSSSFARADLLTKLEMSGNPNPLGEKGEPGNPKQNAYCAQAVQAVNNRETTYAEIDAYNAAHSRINTARNAAVGAQ